MTTTADYPNSYLYLQGYLGDVLVAELAWDDGTYTFVIERALELYDADTEAEATDLIKLHALLDYKAIERAAQDFSTDIDYTADGESYKRSQVPERFDKRLTMAKLNAIPYLPQGQIEQGRMTFPDDPYSIQGQIEHDE